jgi:hypothetical protein
MIVDLRANLVIVGLELLVGNTLGGRTADANLRFSLIFWPAVMIEFRAARNGNHGSHRIARFPIARFRKDRTGQ